MFFILSKTLWLFFAVSLPQGWEVWWCFISDFPGREEDDMKKVKNGEKICLQGIIIYISSILLLFLSLSAVAV